MSDPAQRSYRFSTQAQWRACLFDRVDRAAFEAQGGIRPIPPYEQDARHYPSRGAHAPAATPAGDVLWRDDAAGLHRLAACCTAPGIAAAPNAIAQASRLVSLSNGLWVVGPSRTSLERYGEATLSRLDVVDIADARIVDIAADGHHKLFALIDRRGIVQVVRLDDAGRIVETLTFDGIAHATAFVFLRQMGRFVVLAGDTIPRLFWFAAEGGAAVRSSVIAALHPCFNATALGSDGCGRVFLAGKDGAEFGAKSFVLVFDEDGEPLDQIALDADDSPASGVTGMPGSLFVTGPRGLLRHSIAQAVPDRKAQVHCSLITPALHSPDREDPHRWLRIEARAQLPEGASIEFAWASTGDAALHKRLTAMAGDLSVPASLRLRKLLGEPGIWRTPIAFHGSKSSPGETTAPLSAPLFDVPEPYVWVCITLTATAGGTPPSLDQLAVLYAGHSLMENLPAIYRRTQTQPDSYLRSLVGVLESTTQGFDGHIASLASRVHPATAAGPWLDFVAGWLGLPWDDALDDWQKRSLVAHASDLARGRGTRAGLETLLECVIPGAPPRFRVIDATADIGFAIVDGAVFRGSTLPALLAGSLPLRAKLDSGAVLGQLRLGRGAQGDDGGHQPVGRIRVDIAASEQERRAWEPWLGALIEEMVPLTARVRLRWVSPGALHGVRLDGLRLSGAAPEPRLGRGAILGLARLQ